MPVAVAIGILVLIALEIICYLRPNWSVYENGTMLGGSWQGKWYIYASDGKNKTEIPSDVLPKTWRTKEFRIFQGFLLAGLTLLLLAMLIAFSSSGIGASGGMCMVAGLLIVVACIVWDRTVGLNYGDSFTPAGKDPIAPKSYGISWIMALSGGCVAFLLGLALVTRKDTFVDEAVEGQKPEAHFAFLY